MKKRVLFLLLSVSVWVPLFVIGAQAQYSVKIIKVDVPFEFHAQGRPYPAGSYVVRREGSFLFLRDNNGRLLTVMTANALMSQDPAPASKLVFFQYQGMHLLTQILWEGDKTGAELIRKGREEKAARRVAPAKVERAEASTRP
jgi:hypothetical protein